MNSLLLALIVIAGVPEGTDLPTSTHRYPSAICSRDTLINSALSLANKILANAKNMIILRT